MGTQEVKLERVGEKSVVDGSDPVCSFFIILFIIILIILFVQNLPSSLHSKPGIGR